MIHDAARAISTLRWIEGADHGSVPLVDGGGHDALVQQFVR